MHYQCFMCASCMLSLCFIHAWPVPGQQQAAGMGLPFLLIQPVQAHRFPAIQLLLHGMHGQPVSAPRIRPGGKGNSLLFLFREETAGAYAKQHGKNIWILKSGDFG